VETRPYFPCCDGLGSRDPNSLTCDFCGDWGNPYAGSAARKTFEDSLVSTVDFRWGPEQYAILHWAMAQRPAATRVRGHINPTRRRVSMAGVRVPAVIEEEARDQGPPLSTN
jgi:hypothetical protein